jgi:hypothetical protein
MRGNWMRLTLGLMFLLFAIPAIAQSENRPIERQPLLKDYVPNSARMRPQTKPMLFSPKYQLKGEDPHYSGWCFMVYHPDSLFPILLTAHHHFTRQAGLTRNISGRDLPERFQSFKATAANNSSFAIDQGNILRLPQARSITSDSYNYDLAAILLFKNYPEYGAELRKTRPELGEKLWLHASLAKGDWFPSTVTFSDDSGMEIELADASINLRSVSGSPLIDREGKVAGMLLRSVSTDDGKLYGLAISSDQINHHISQALKR